MTDAMLPIILLEELRRWRRLGPSPDAVATNLRDLQQRVTELDELVDAYEATERKMVEEAWERGTPVEVYVPQGGWIVVPSSRGSHTVFVEPGAEVELRMRDAPQPLIVKFPWDPNADVPNASDSEPATATTAALP